MWRAVVVLALVPSILAAGRGDACINQNGKKATCTTLVSCKAAMDAAAIANGTPVVAAGVLCGYDSEPLVCCQTPEDFAISAVDGTVEYPEITTDEGVYDNGITERPRPCVNQHGKKATCTTLASCKAAMDAAALANGTRVVAAGVLCGYDKEPLVCCQTSEDYDDTQKETDISSLGFSPGSVEITVDHPEIPETAGAGGSANSITERADASGEHTQGTSTSKHPEDAIYTSPPIENKGQTFEATTPQPTTVAPTTPPVDPLPLASNGTNKNSIPNIPDIFTPGQPLDSSTEAANAAIPPDTPPFDPFPSKPETNSNEGSDAHQPQPPQFPGGCSECANEGADPHLPQFPGHLPPTTSGHEGSNPLFPQFPENFPPIQSGNEGSNPQFPQVPETFPPIQSGNEGSNPQFPQVPESPPPVASGNEGSTPQVPQVLENFPPIPSENEGAIPQVPQVLENLPPIPGGNEGSVPQVPESFPPIASGNEGSMPQVPQFPENFPPNPSQEGYPPQLPGSFPGGFPSGEFPPQFPYPGSAGGSSGIPGYPTPFYPNPGWGFSTITTESVPIEALLPDRNTCGLQHERKRMAHWPISTIDEFPWTALLNYGFGERSEAGFRCAGTLISKNYVVSAAQCLKDDMYYLKSVRLGDWSLSSLRDCVHDHKGEECSNGYLDIGVAHKIPHPQYDPSTGANNIGLIQLEKHVEFSDFVRPICLPVEDLKPPSPYTILTTSGWGSSKNGVQLDIKSKYSFVVVRPESCSKLFKYQTIMEGTLCMGTLTKMRQCFADSGGPVMVEHSDGKSQWYLEGIIPDGFNCGQGHGPYMRVTQHVHWIMHTLSSGAAT